MYSLFIYSFSLFLSPLSSLVCLFFSHSPLFCASMLSRKRSCTQCKRNFLRPPGTGSFQGWGQAPFVSRARLGQQEWEEEQALNKNIVSAAFTQSATMCAGFYREQDNLCLMRGLRGRGRAVGQAGMTEGRRNKREAESAFWSKRSGAYFPIPQPIEGNFPNFLFFSIP